MSGVNKTLIRAGLETLFFSGAHLMMQPFVGGVGSSLRSPLAASMDGFQPNRLLEVIPDFFAEVVLKLRRSRVFGLLDEMHRRLTEGDSAAARLLALTTAIARLAMAYPVLRKHEYRSRSTSHQFPRRIGELWWLASKR